MRYLKKRYTILFSLILSVLFYSCVDDMELITEGDSYSIIKGDKVEVHLRVNLDNSGSDRVRTRDTDRSNDGIHNPDYSDPGIGHGTLATTLIYQLFDEDGEAVALPNPDSSQDIIGLHQVRVENRKFPYSDIVFTVDNGKEYTMIFWAQSGEDGNNSDDSETKEGNNGNKHNTKGDWYYDTDDLKNILVRYDSQNIDGRGQWNNTDSRDAFCAKVKFTGGQPLPEVTLKRVVAQINVGFTQTLWEKLQRSNIDIKKSSIWIANVGRRFNLYKNQVELFSNGDESEDGISKPEDNTGQGGITWPFTMGSFTSHEIPAYMEYPDRNNTEDIMLQIGDEKYHWVSMCYILAPGETDEEWVNGISVPHDHGSTVDIVSLQFFDSNDVAYNLPLTSLSNIPVKRNYRTNILVDDLFNATVSMDAQIGPDTYDDFGYSDGAIIDGELTPGLTYKELEGVSHWGDAYSNGFAFYVSSLQGLKWLADRSNGLDFRLKDIPDWMIKKEGWQDLNDQEKLKAYEKKILDLFFNKNRALLKNARGKEYAFRNQWGYRMPITFDDCIIYLTNDLDFNDDQEIKESWHGFSCNMSYYNGEQKNDNAAQWYMTSSRNPLEYEEVTGTEGYFQYSNSQTNDPHGFKGTIDGQGYTIYNMVINNLADFNEYSEMTGDIYGPRKLHNSAFVCTASANATIKDLRLYNAYIKGDYNIGGFVGYYKGERPLTLSNCRFVNSRIEGAEPQRYSPSDDANVGGIAGSLASHHTIEGCQVINCDIISTFIGAAFVGISGVRGDNMQRNYSNNRVYDTNVVLSEFNNIGTYNGAVERSTWSVSDSSDPSFFFGTNATSDISGFYPNTGDCSINTFYGIKYSPLTTSSGADIPQSANITGDGKSYISKVPLELFPDIYTEYAQEVKLQSHIIGKARQTDGVNYGLKIDISGQPKTRTRKLISIKDDGTLDQDNSKDADPFWKFTLSSDIYKSQPLEGQIQQLGEKFSRQHVILVSPKNLNNVKGVYICAPELPKNAVRHVTIKDVIIAGEPSVEYGLYLDNVKEMYLDHVAIYDVKHAFGSKNIPQDATFTTYECDFRGITNIGPGYKNVLFENTDFNKGSGRTENIIGRLYAESSATLKKCIFRVDYKIVVKNKDAVLTFEDCLCGPPYNQISLTKENFWKYMDSTSSEPFLGKVKFSGDSKEYTYEELLSFKPQ